MYVVHVGTHVCNVVYMMYVPCGKYYMYVPFFQGIQKLSTIEKKYYRCSCEHDGLSSDY